MKKIYIVLVGLLCACNSNNDKKAAAPSKKQLLTGRWQLDSLDIGNKTNDDEINALATYLLSEDRYKHVQFGFTESGILTEYDDDSSGIDARFELRGDSLILPDLEPQEILLVKKLDATNLILVTSDTVRLFFKRTK